MISPYHDSPLIDLITKAHRQVFFTQTTQELFGDACQVSNDYWCQVFKLTPAGQNPSVLIQAPKVMVCIGLKFDPLLPKNCLEISYFIEKTPLIDFAANNNFTQADFLWQENCLECFVQYGKTDAYFEVNVAPDGRYNIYHFDNYRTPNIMPPRQAKPDDILINNNNCHDIISAFYTRHIRLISHDLPIRLNPTVILYAADKPIFYATCHAKVPDFHDKQFWQDLNQSASIHF